jgi:hypothetical protein
MDVGMEERGEIERRREGQRGERVRGGLREREREGGGREQMLRRRISIINKEGKFFGEVP